MPSPTGVFALHNPKSPSRICGARGALLLASARKNLSLGGALRRHVPVGFLQAGGLAAQSAEEVQLSATDAAAAGDVNLVDHARVHRKDALDSVAEAHLANGKAGLRARGLLDHDAF